MLKLRDFLLDPGRPRLLRLVFYASRLNAFHIIGPQPPDIVISTRQHALQINLVSTEGDGVDTVALDIRHSDGEVASPVASCEFDHRNELEVGHFEETIQRTIRDCPTLYLILVRGHCDNQVPEPVRVRLAGEQSHSDYYCTKHTA